MRAAALLLPLLLLAPVPLMAATHDAALDGSGPVNGAADDQLVWDALATVAGDGQGNYVSIWVPTIETCEQLVAISSDHGVSWSEQFPLKTNIGFDNALVDTEPATETDGQGTWIALWASTDMLGGTTDPNYDILGARSIDNGATWTAPALVSAPVSFYTRGPDTATDGQGNWIASWWGSGVQYVRSTDNGATWEPPVTLLMGQSSRQVRVHTDKAGTWIIVWSTAQDINGFGADQDILYVRSTDAGLTWSPIRAVNTDATGPTHVDEQPAIAYAGGTWVVAWKSWGGLGDTLGDDFDLLYARSTNGGLSWSDPAILNSDAATDSFGQADEQVSIHGDPNGNWFAAWRGNKGSASGIYAARSSDGGATWTDAVLMGLDTGPTDSHPLLDADALNNWLILRDSTGTLGGTVGGDRDVLATRFRLPFDATCASDADLDGFGSPGDASCPLGPAIDCDDGDLRVGPGAVQSCDGLNNDCAHPSWPALAGTNEVDDDGDGFSECAGDCADGDPTSWAVPSVVAGVVFNDPSEMRWDPPAAPGADPSTLVYDVLRSVAPFACNLLGPQLCLETDDDTDRVLLDTDEPDPGQVYFYQVRAENNCSATGRLGNSGERRLRIAVDCE